MCGATILALLGGVGTAAAQEAAKFNIAPQPLASALNEFAVQSPWPILYTTTMTGGKMTAGVKEASDPEMALNTLLEGTGLGYRREGETFLIVQGGSDPQPASAAGGGATVEALIVTAQKREEDIQDVPIAISAFSAEKLDALKIEGGFDLLKAIPNVTFSKNNFTSYNFSIRGVGTKAVSATTDPGVAVAFNNTTIIQNRLFEQEYFDVERVEVLRGPQGTLYGRNATSGVINVISAKPDLNDFEGFIKGEVGNFDTKRLSAMLNVPLVEDRLAVRFAGALTDREGYDFNAVTQNAVNGRSLWSGRLTVGFEPTERIRGNLIWERFEEDDDRSRTGKQLCHHDDGPEMIGDAIIDDDPGDLVSGHVRRALFGQGCKPGNLYDPAAFGTPNGLSYNFVLGLLGLKNVFTRIGYLPDGEGGFEGHTLIQDIDPYGDMMQSPDLRVISSFRDPIYRAKADLLELNFDVDVTDALTFSSQTAYVEDEVYSFQDYNRFNTLPIFTDSSQLTNFSGTEPSDYRDITPGGIFCDPQLGCSDTIAGFDISQAEAKQFSQELRLQSSFDGPVNFSIGANYTEFEALVDYYIMFNLITAMAMIPPFNQPVDGVFDPTVCFDTKFLNTPTLLFRPPTSAASIEDPSVNCPYIDPNPVESINGDGHNYFRSINPYELESWAGFGELYWDVNDSVKLTAGLRYTDDRKTFIPVPTQLLLAPTVTGGGTVSRGYPEDPPVVQQWGEWTGRLGLDWRPELTFTEETMLYAFYSRGYKGGGANPPRPGFATLDELVALGELTQEEADQFAPVFPVLQLTGVEYEDTFEAEFVDAYEIGAKNTLLGGAMTFNATAFYYDYKDYQVSQIRDRTAVNENFDAKVWGLEFETVFSPTPNLQFVGNLGYLDTKVGDGETSIDIMDRTQSNPDYTLVKPWVQLPSNCVLPTPVAEYWVADSSYLQYYWTLCSGVGGVLGALAIGNELYDPTLDAPYDPANYPELNGGAGLAADLSGNELPNAPHWTANIGAQYGWDMLSDWRMTVRGDAYWQSQSWHRVYNLDPYDKLHGWYNVNLSVWVERPADGLKIELYAKNVLDDTPITDAFLNSDDTGLTTNVFTLDPRLIGLSIRKEF